MKRRPGPFSGAVRISSCRMPLLLFNSQDGATSARRQTLLARRPTGATLRDGDQKLGGNETAAFSERSGISGVGGSGQA